MAEGISDLQLPCSDAPCVSSVLKTHGQADSPYPRAPVDESSGLGCTDTNMSCSDLLSLRSDSVSVCGSRRSRQSQEDDARSLTASSVMSLLQRVTLGPLDKDWMRSCASGNTAIQRVLLDQEPGLLHKKGYTPLHMASIHGHRHIVLALVNIYNAKTNIRDYHGKMAAHYWTGSTDIFNKPDLQTVAVFGERRRTQRYALPSLLLSRSRSQEHIRLEFNLPNSSSQETMENHF